MKTMIMAVVLACLPAAAIAQTDTTTAPTVSAPTDAGATVKPEKKKKEARICREGVGANSRISSRRCKTADEWAALDARGADGAVAGGVNR